MTAGSAAPTPPSPTRRPPSRTPTGMHDVLWPESVRWEDTVVRFAALVEGAGYGLALTPIVEHDAVFNRGIGEKSEVVGKEMYVFEDRDGQLMALRPEGTASVARAFVQHHPVPPWKAWYVAPLFRHERPQQGRYRQHYQLGVEALGVADADLDVEVVALAHDFFAGFGLRQVTLKLHSMGDGVCKPGYVALLGEFLAARVDQLCPAHRARHLENPLRVLDCKTPECRAATEDAPHFLDHLCDACAAHFARVRQGLDALGRRLHHRPPPGPGLRLLHPHHVRVRRRGARRRPERHRRRRALRRPGRGARRRPHPGHRVRHRHRAGRCWPVTPRASSPPRPPWRPGPCTPT